MSNRCSNKFTVVHTEPLTIEADKELPCCNCLTYDKIGTQVKKQIIKDFDTFHAYIIELKKEREKACEEATRFRKNIEDVVEGINVDSHSSDWLKIIADTLRDVLNNEYD